MLEQHGSTRSTRSSRLARHVERVESCRDVTRKAKWNLGLSAWLPQIYRLYLSDQITLTSFTETVSQRGSRIFRLKTASPVPFRSQLWPKSCMTERFLTYWWGFRRWGVMCRGNLVRVSIHRGAWGGTSRYGGRGRAAEHWVSPEGRTTDAELARLSTISDRQSRLEARRRRLTVMTSLRPQGDVTVAHPVTSCSVVAASSMSPIQQRHHAASVMAL